MSGIGCLCPSARAITFASLPVGIAYIVAPDVTDHATGVFGGYTSLRTAFSMGRLDCLGIDHSDHSKRSGNMRNAKDLGQ